jgi:hypothetical protein
MAKVATTICRTASKAKNIHIFQWLEGRACRLDRPIGHNYVARGFGGVRAAGFRLPIWDFPVNMSTV